MSSRISKITPATIGCKPQLCTIDDKIPEVECALLFGEASGVAIKTTPNGDSFTAMIGKFEATNLHTGEVFNSGVCYLPGGMHEMITQTLITDQNAIVKFGILLVAKKTDNLAGYSWIGRDVVDLEQADPLIELKQAMKPEMHKYLLTAYAEKKLQLPDLSHVVQGLQPGEIIDNDTQEVVNTSRKKK